LNPTNKKGFILEP